MLTEERAKETIVEHRRNIDFYLDHVSEIQEANSGRHVVIYSQRVQHVCERPEEIKDVVRKISEEQLASAMIRYVPRKDEIFIV